MNKSTIYRLLLVLVTAASSAPSAMLASALSTNLKKTALVTGATDGIGLTTAKNLAAKGYRVIVHGRDPERIKKACAVVNRHGGGDEDAVPALADLSSVRGCHDLADMILQQHAKLDLLVNNAGVYVETKRLVGEHELEKTFAVNVLAPFVVTSLLLPLLTDNDGRIVLASSISQCSDIQDWDNVLRCGHTSFSSHRTYSESKLLDAMLTFAMAKRLTKTTVNCLDPGTVNTKMLLAGWGACGIEVEDALDETWLSTSDDVAGSTGKYYVGRSERKSSAFAYREEEQTRMWDMLSALAPEAASRWDAL